MNHLMPIPKPIPTFSKKNFNHLIDKLNTYILTYLEFLNSTKNSAGKNAVFIRGSRQNFEQTKLYLYLEMRFMHIGL